MDVGAAMFFTDYSMGAGELAQALEARGFESMWAPEHSHIPTSRRSPFAAGGDLPKQYYDVMDPFVTLSAAAVVTNRIKLGTGVCLIIQRDPIQTAKLVASIDQVSNGRFLFGVGGGWNAEEMEDHGTVFKTRFKLMRERVEAMKAIWTDGGAFPHSARRALRYGDGWIPNASRPQYEDVTDFLPHFRQMAAEMGRDLAAVPVTVWGAGEDYDRLRRYQDQGVARVVVSLPPEPADQTLPALDRWAELIRRIGR